MTLSINMTSIAVFTGLTGTILVLNLMLRLSSEWLPNELRFRGRDSERILGLDILEDLNTARGSITRLECLEGLCIHMGREWGNQLRMSLVQREEEGVPGGMEQVLHGQL
jgi:hypothetical protein